MKLLTKAMCLGFKKIKFKTITQNFFYGKCIRPSHSTLLEKNYKNFPYMGNILKQQKILEDEIKDIKHVLLIEFYEECCFSDSFSTYGNKSLLSVSMGKLSTLGVIPKIDVVIENMLTYIETFPFVVDQKFIAETLEGEKLIRNVEDLTVPELRNIIETCYIAWKFEVDFKTVEKLKKSYSKSLFLGRSLRSLKKNMNSFLEHPEINKLDVDSKVFVVLQMYLDTDIRNHFQNDLLGLDWYTISLCCPAILKLPHKSVMLHFKGFKGEKFSDEQLIRAFSVLGLRPSVLMSKLNYFDKRPELCKYRQDIDFLRCLVYCNRRKYKHVDWDQISYEEIKYLVSKEPSLSKGFISSNRFSKGIKLYLKLKLKATDEELEPLEADIKKYRFSLSDMCKTLAFLQEEFTREEIIDCIFMVFYPRSVIEWVLKFLRLNEDKFQGMFSAKGYISENNLFKLGSKSTNKTLHLCLYYIQKAQNFEKKQPVNLNSGIFDQ